MKYRNSNSPRSDFSQSFTEEVKDYILDPVSNELQELPIPKNIQQYIQSFVGSCLERTLERFLPSNVEESNDTYADYTERVEDLSRLGEAMELAEEYREVFHLPDNATMAQIFAAVDKNAQELKSKLVAPVAPVVDEKVKGDK